MAQAPGVVVCRVDDTNRTQADDFRQSLFRAGRFKHISGRHCVFVFSVDLLVLLKCVLCLLLCLRLQLLTDETNHHCGRLSIER